MTFRALKTLFDISRPRFWIYVFGPYIVGMMVGAHRLSDLKSPLVPLFALYFTLPANLLIYGVNDLFDYETDRLNPKKRGYESPVAPERRRGLWWAIGVSNLPFIALLPFCGPRAIGAMVGFWFFSLQYSAPPIRAKARPLLDSAFNVLYIFPGVFAYYLTGGEGGAVRLFMAAWLWAMAMHAYSAVPDISSDRSVNLPTIATWLGVRGTLWFCLGLYAASALLSWPELRWLSAVLGAVYIALMGWSLRAGSEDGVRRVYRVFPVVNALAGAALWWFVALTKFVGRS